MFMGLGFTRSGVFPVAAKGKPPPQFHESDASTQVLGFLLRGSTRVPHPTSCDCDCDVSMMMIFITVIARD